MIIRKARRLLAGIVGAAAVAAASSAGALWGGWCDPFNRGGCNNGWGGYPYSGGYGYTPYCGGYTYPSTSSSVKSDTGMQVDSK